VYPFVQHPDVARIRGVAPMGYHQPNPHYGTWNQRAVLPAQARQLQWYRPGGDMHLNPAPIHAYTARQVSGTVAGCPSGCPGQIQCANCSCVNTVTACDADAQYVMPGSTKRRSGTGLRRNPRRRRKNATAVDYLLGAFGLKGMPGYR